MKNTDEKNTKNRLQLNLELLNQSFQMRQKREELLSIRINKEINKLTQNLIALPEVYIHDIIDIFENDEIPHSTFINFFSAKINAELITSLGKINNIVDKINDEPF